MRNQWISPRLWRSPESRFTKDEPLASSKIYSSQVLEGIREQGFDAIWMHGRLRELTHGEILPDLNEPLAAQRIAHLQQVILRADNLGMKVFLYFNEPLGLPTGHPFWDRHPDIKGERWYDPEVKVDELAMCASNEKVMNYLRESVENLFSDLPMLGGVILITASEFHTHCWSHKALRTIGDRYVDRCLTPMQCPRCRQREPAEMATELIRVWAEQAEAFSPPPEVWAWNWSWSMWYDHPQAEVIGRLPPKVKLMLDFERGGERLQKIGKVAIDEYSLGYVGPSARFEDSRAAAVGANVGVCAKLQLGTTHELATVPNLPLAPNIFEKLEHIDNSGIQGVMGSWNFGNSPSLNTAAFKLFVERADLRHDVDAFCRQLAAEYFGASRPEEVTAAWKLFCEAFNEYPFSIEMLYHGPMNYAVAYPLSHLYHDRPMGPSWRYHFPFGDRLSDVIEPFTPDLICACLDSMHTLWQEGLKLYGQATRKERNVAEMIGLHIAAMRNIFSWHRWRQEQMSRAGLSGPCTLSVDDTAARLLRNHLELMHAAKSLVEQDKSFGYHQEPGVYFYTPDMIDDAILVTRESLSHTVS